MKFISLRLRKNSSALLREGGADGGGEHERGGAGRDAEGEI